MKEDEFYAPPVPKPRKKTQIPLDSPELSKKILVKIEKVEKFASKETKTILVYCERCNEKILIPIQKRLVLESEEKEILITCVHKNTKNRDRHCIIFEIDRSFNVQLPKAADVIISTETMKPTSIKKVFIQCLRCDETITIPVPKNMIKKSKMSKIPIAYIHNNKYGMDQHCIIAYLDRNFGDRDTRLSNILIMNLYPTWD